MATSQNALGDLLSHHTILPTQQSTVAGSIPQAKSSETTTASHMELVTETHLACLLKAMTVFRDILRGFILSLIRARFDHALSVDNISNIVISELLEFVSYPKSEHGDPDVKKASGFPDKGPETLHAPSPPQTR